MSKIVLVGATGFTGRLTARALVDRGVAPLLVGRSHERLQTLATELGGAETAHLADLGDLGRLVTRGDVVVSMVGPYSEHGAPVVTEAIDAGAHYVDCSGEHSFIRRVFEEFDAPARAQDVTLLTGFGADWVPGNLAGALALRDAGESAERVSVWYIITGDTFAFSEGSTATGRSMMANPSVGYAFRDGALVDAPRAVREFTYGGDTRVAHLAAGSEHFGLPRFAPQLRDVEVLLSFPPIEEPEGPDGPSDAQRAQNEQHIVAVAHGPADRRPVHLRGQNGYDYTAEILAWAATQLQSQPAVAVGACAPTDRFGLDELLAGSTSCGLGVATASSFPDVQFD